MARNPRKKALAVARAVALVALAGCGSSVSPPACRENLDNSECAAQGGRGGWADGGYVGCCCGGHVSSSAACCASGCTSCFWTGDGCAIPGPFVPPSMV